MSFPTSASWPAIRIRLSRPNQDITRAEAAKIIAMFDNGATDISALYTSANPFTLTSKGNWAESYIAYGYKAGIIAGVGKLNCSPRTPSSPAFSS
jgi:hypothetical protein